MILWFISPIPSREPGSDQSNEIDQLCVLLWATFSKMFYGVEDVRIASSDVFLFVTHSVESIITAEAMLFLDGILRRELNKQIWMIGRPIERKTWILLFFRFCSVSIVLYFSNLYQITSKTKTYFKKGSMIISMGDIYQSINKIITVSNSDDYCSDKA